MMAKPLTRKLTGAQMNSNIDALTIRFPARPGYLMVSRLNASTIAGSAGFDVDEIDDLRLAVNEAVTWLLADEESGGEVEVELSAGDGRVQIDGVRRANDLPDRPVDELIEAILAVTVDEFRLSEHQHAERRISLTKTKGAPDAA